MFNFRGKASQIMVIKNCHTLKVFFSYFKSLSYGQHSFFELLNVHFPQKNVTFPD